jgi:bifunctional non-homologous end joining protein LigD
MLLTAATDIPVGKNWLYEVKYDGFRCLLEWEEESPILMSRNGNILNSMFPETITFCQTIQDQIQPFLPIKLDGELVYLSNDVQSTFSIVQVRGRMRTQSVILKHSTEFPCHYIAFDLMEINGESQSNQSIEKRKKVLQNLFKSLKLPASVDRENPNLVQAIDVYKQSKVVWNKVQIGNGEGIVAKEKSSRWESDYRTANWVKIKNWKYVTVILTRYDKGNGFFHGSIYNRETLNEIVTFRHGLSEDERKTLSLLFQSNGKTSAQGIWELEPSICVDIACIDFDGKHLREPRFHAFNFETSPSDCTWRHMQRQLFPLPEKLQITNPDKPIWPKIGVEKDDYLLYLQNVSSMILPFLRDRLLTVIRYTHGAGKESFYQKNTPDSVPDFIITKQEEDTRFLLCNNVESLLWLGNQHALEFHIPFQTHFTNKPMEIVFDLDPPSVNEFPLAIESAVRMKAIFDQFGLPSYVKTSGRKGLQVYIPLPLDAFTYEETRVFTKFVCHFLCEQEPQWFTTERLIKNRNNKLYLDYVQHKEGKTIIAPYSPRGTDQGLIATPLHWNEVNESLRPDQFTIHSVMDRLKKQGDPFRDFRNNIDGQTFKKVLKELKELVLHES